MSIDDVPPSQGAELVVCAICGRVLTYHGPQGRYVHSIQDYLNEDHPAVAVKASELQDHNARCDFCNADVKHEDIWTVPASDFEEPPIPGAYPGMSVGDWAACATCVNLVQRERWTQLVARVTEGRKFHAETKAWVRQLYRKLAVHITGEPYREGTRRTR